MLRVYGVEIGKCPEGVNADSILNMSERDKMDLLAKAGVDGEVYEIESFFYYLNNDGIDTENYYWVVL